MTMQTNLDMFAGTTALRFPGTRMKADQSRPESSEALNRIGSRVPVERDEAIWREGDQAEACYRVEAGCVRVSRLLSDGRRYVIDFLFPGDFLGLAEPEIHDCTAEALTSTVLSRYPRRQLMIVADSDLHTSNTLRRALNAALGTAHTQRIVLARLSAEERLATFLLDMCKKVGGGRRIRLPMSRGDIGDHLGLTVETVSRTFTKFRSRGWIRLDGCQDVTLLDLESLGHRSELGLSLAA